MTNKKIGLRIASTGLAAALLSSGTLTGLGSAEAASSAASDVKGHWAESRIAQWTELGWIRGYADGTFRPDASITRAEFAALANRAFGLKGYAPTAFSDVKASSWASKEVSAAVAAGYASGASDGTFRPNEPITRQEAALMVVRLLKLTPDADAANAFADAASIPTWSKGAIGAAVESGIISGYSDRTYRPLKTASRSEAIAMLQNAIDKGSITYDRAGTYGPQKGLAVAAGGVAITIPNVVLQNTVVKGNLLLDKGIGEGDAELRNVTVLGKTEVRGGGANSIHIVDSGVSDLIVNKQSGAVRTVAEGEADIGSTVVQGPAILEEEGNRAAGFHDVELSENIPAGSNVSLSGGFDNLEVNSSGTSLNIPSGSVSSIVVSESAAGLTLNLAEGVTVQSLELNAPVTVTGQGIISSVRMSDSARAGSTFARAPLSGATAPTTTLTNPADSSPNTPVVRPPTNAELANAVSVRIGILPDLAALKLSDETAVKQVVASYENLTAEQKALLSDADRTKLQQIADRISELKAEHAADLAAAEAVRAEIAGLPSATALTLNDEAAVEAALAAFDALTPTRKQLVSAEALALLANAKVKIDELKTRLAADIAAAGEVATLIAALPSAAVLDLTNETAVAEAKAAYEALTPAQRGHVAAADLATLNDAVAKIADLNAKLAADIAAANEVAVQIAALPAAALLTLNDEAEVNAVKTAYEALTPEQQEHVSTQDVATLTDAVDKIEALNVQLAADIAAAGVVATKISALPQAALLTLADEAEVDAAKAAYDALTPAEQSHVQTEDLATLNAAVTKIADLNAKLTADIAAADAVAAKITALPATLLLTLDDEAGVQAAETAYEALTAEQKDHVKAKDVSTLNDAIAKIAELNAKLLADIAAANAVAAKITALPSALLLTLSNEAAVVEAKTAYEALTVDQRIHVKAEDKATLEAAVAKIAELKAKLAADIEAAGAVTSKIAELPETLLLTLDHETAVADVQAAYDALTADQKGHVEAADVDALNSAVAKIAELKAKLAADIEAADEVARKITALPSAAALTLNDQASVAAAKSAYEALTPEQKQHVGTPTLNLLNAAVSKIEALQADVQAAANVDTLIQALPATAALTLQNEDAVGTAQAAYDALTPTRKSLVKAQNLTKLEAAVAKIADLNAQLALDKEAANQVTAKITALPIVSSLTLGDQAAVQAANTEFDQLTSAQKAWVSQDDQTRLTQSVNRIRELIADQAAADSVTAKIAALPEATSVTLSNEAAVQEAQTAYSALTLAQQSLISTANYAKLTDAVARIASLKTPYTLRSKDITNFDYKNVPAVQAQLKSKILTSSDFSANPVKFTISDGVNVVPVDLWWNIPQNDGFTVGQVVGSAIDSSIQDYFYKIGGSDGIMNRTMWAADWSAGNTFVLGSYQNGSASKLILGGNWQALFDTGSSLGTDGDARSRSFTVSNGLKTTTISLNKIFIDPDGAGSLDALDDMVSYINQRFASASLTDAKAVRVGQAFEIQLPKTYSGLTIAGTNKSEFFTEFQGK
ncbi:S-layer homology domain-containing protein [Saccharibacillus endophyticus]|uniref:SLH domain-containing protein n=1 Tax=Saccharibacillus endophyticus TaxID=2060666 RepID=A0ABQ2A5X3_9BACL|nr:S-layer homology domain-containing protein [Saccharibacillus endophyticus]GGH85998.1 hypothetical protein GCM10007362_44740 [Saccharibacillus endophyticus]